MPRQLGDPAVRQGFEAIVAGARDKDELAKIAAAEQDAIAYYYDVLKTMALKHLNPAKDRAYPDPAAMKSAVREINRACANQKRSYLFNGQLADPADLFAFASGICMPAAQA